MNKVENYCKEHPPVAWAEMDFLTLVYLHDIDYNVADSAYVSIRKGNHNPTYHKLKIRYTIKGRPFVRILSGSAYPLPRSRVYLDEFYRYE